MFAFQNSEGIFCEHENGVCRQREQTIVSQTLTIDYGTLTGCCSVADPENAMVNDGSVLLSVNSASRPLPVRDLISEDESNHPSDDSTSKWSSFCTIWRPPTTMQYIIIKQNAVMYAQFCLPSLLTLEVSTRWAATREHKSHHIEFSIPRMSESEPFSIRNVIFVNKLRPPLMKVPPTRPFATATSHFMRFGIARTHW